MQFDKLGLQIIKPGVDLNEFTVRFCKQEYKLRSKWVKSTKIKPTKLHNLTDMHLCIRPTNYILFDYTDTNSFALKNKMTKQEFELLFSELEESGKS
ncbi:MAG: hypothetical protein M3Q56_10960, partial [Bacteroidota bacterium]|nr:hypothetical protein [Bacteroidota bacterium]